MLVHNTVHTVLLLLGTNYFMKKKLVAYHFDESYASTMAKYHDVLPIGIEGEAYCQGVSNTIGKI